MHCDTLVNYQEEGKDFLSEGTMFSLRNLPLFHRLCQTMAIFVPDTVRGPEAEAYFDRNCAYFKTLLKKQGDLAAQARSGEEIERRLPGRQTGAGGGAVSGRRPFPGPGVERGK